MKDIRIKFVVFICCSFCALLCKAQNDTTSYIPEVGSRFRDYVFKNVIDYDKSELSTADFRGKWLLIDGWTSSCIGCVASFPKMNKIAEDFKEKLELILVGEVDQNEDVGNSKIWKLYERLRKQHKLRMTAAFDKYYLDKVRAFSVPYILLVDPNGMIAAKTYGIDSTLIAAFLQGKRPPYPYTYSAGERKVSASYDRKLPLLTSGKKTNGGLDTVVISRSVLSPWNVSMPHSDYGYWNDRIQPVPADPKRAELFGNDICYMLLIAYKGDNDPAVPLPDGRLIYPEPIFEVEDPKRFGRMKPETGENMYSYSLISPITDLNWRRKKLLTDLQDAFLFDSKIEDRKVPAWHVIVVDPKKVRKLETKGGQISLGYRKDSGEYFLHNIPLKNLPSILKMAVRTFEGYQKQEGPIVMEDETGISMNIDMWIPSYFDFEKVQKELLKNGLKLEKTTITKPCIVVTDRKVVASK